MRDCRLLASISLIVLCSCQPKGLPPDKPIATNRLPTATEVFDLRSKCVALGEKILAGNIIGSALAQEQVSHYNPESNRCYVKLDVHSADLTTPYAKYIQHTILYDGQTRELLAAVNVEGEKKWGSVWSEPLKKLQKDPIGPTFEEAISIIDKFMAEDRRP